MENDLFKNRNSNINIIRNRTNAFFQRYMEKTWETLSPENRTAYFIQNIKDNILALVPEATEISQEVDTALDLSQNKDILIKKAIEVTIKIVAKYLSTEEIEDRLREKHVTHPGTRELSRALTFKINNEAQRVELHVPVTFFQNLHEPLQSFKEGLETLAKRMITDEELKNINEVRGFSILIKDNPRVLTSLGFKITLDENGKPTKEARISKEKLLELYGKNIDLEHQR